MKTCAKCHTEKPLTEFTPRPDRKNGYQSYCITCKSLANTEAYKKDPSAARKRALASKERLREDVTLYKFSKGCCICDEENPYSLDFHHLNSELKEEGVSLLVKSGSRKRAFLEIEKCIVICATHHRALHAGYITLVGPN